MSKWMPPKPMLRRIDHTRGAYGFGIYSEDFNEWYDKEIKPLFENAEDVRLCDSVTRTAHLAEPIDAKHKALLIRIEAIKEESAEDILREILKVSEEIDNGKYVCLEKSRIKAYLGRKK